MSNRYLTPVQKSDNQGFIHLFLLLFIFVSILVVFNSIGGSFLPPGSLPTPTIIAGLTPTPTSAPTHFPTGVTPTVAVPTSTPFPTHSTPPTPTSEPTSAPTPTSAPSPSPTGPHQPGTTHSVNAVGAGVRAGSDSDDPAIWIHPTDPSKSLMFLSDKGSGIYAFNFNRQLCEHINFRTALNNVDVRKGFMFGNQSIDIVAANLRDIGKLAVLKINPNHSCDSNTLDILADNNSTTNLISRDSYGFTLYKRPSDGRIYVFEKPKSSAPVVQWEVDGSNGNTIRLIKKREFTGMGVAEGFVADDQLGFVYFAEEARGINKFYADPDQPTTRISQFATGDGTASDREGLALYACNDGRGYLVLSSQGNDRFMVYNRQGNNEYIKTFTTDRSKGTDGLDVTAYAVPGFPQGVAIIQDDGGKDYFLYRWEDISKGELAICVNGQ